MNTSRSRARGFLEYHQLPTATAWLPDRLRRERIIP
jgi:hypothetical protein